MRFESAQRVQITIAQEVLDAVFDDCDKYDDVETGGRIVGTYTRGRTLDVHVSGVIDAGPAARRARTSFFQDGDYQEQVFRAIERDQPAVEHLGTWHTHHVNGYPHLSSGDLETYHRTVNHPQHNLDFWYALLVTEKVNRPARYLVKHYLFLRGDKAAYEVPARSVRIVKERALWVPSTKHAAADRQPEAVSQNAPLRTTPERRSADDVVLRSLFPDLRPFVSSKTGSLSWKGPIELIDSTTSGVIVTETLLKGDAFYEAATGPSDRERFPHAAAVRDATPWLALKSLETNLNRAVVGFEKKHRSRAE
jgi:integrative and conjugative element protein (TIGR02256 family)